MSVMPESAPVTALIRKLDAAVALEDPEAICRDIKAVLADYIQHDQEFLDPRFLRPRSDRYARRLLHKDPAGRYSVLVMVWGVGQATPLHDHAGTWCVEAVYRGRIRVTSYSLQSEPQPGVMKFAREGEVLAGVGEAGHLIPPFEYHVLANAAEVPAVTIHVYAGEMTWCHVFNPEGDVWRRERRELAYYE
jgi:predicted metal-dependent enzyme (double-stranded beta helix superfamily)